MAKRSILITGSAGFIGSHLVEELDGHFMVIPYDIKEGYKGDVLDKDFLHQAMKGVDIVIHCAATCGISSVDKRPADVIATNVLGTYNVFNAAAMLDNVELVINFSTSEVYGPRVYDGRESDPTFQEAIGSGRWHYAVGKLAGEYFADCFYRQERVNYVNVRPFNVFGPGQVGEGAIHNMVVKALSGEDLIVDNSGAQIRSWCYIDDFVLAIKLILAYTEKWNTTYNIGNPRNTLTVYSLAEKIVQLTQSKSDIICRTKTGPEVQYRMPNIEKLAGAVGFSPKVGLDEGLMKTIEWYRSKL